MAEVDRWKKHATRFGVEQVMEAAAEDGLSMSELVELQGFVDEIVARNKWAPKKKLSATVRVRRLLGLPDEEEE